MRFAILFLSILWLGSGEKLVKTRIHSKWTGNSILEEIGEYLAQEDEKLFWKFVDAVNENVEGVVVEKASPQDLYNFGISIASRLLNPSEIPLLKFALSSRIHSPRLQIHFQISRHFRSQKCADGNSNSFWTFGQKIGCRLSELELDQFSADFDGKIWNFDHFYPGKSGNRTIFIYGKLGSLELKNLIFEARKLTEKVENLNFVLRFADLSRNSEKISLSGYGVELALKNTEYKAMDQNHKNLSTEGDGAPENLHGLNFRILTKLHKTRLPELESLKENLGKMGEIVELKQWQLKDLGMKTCGKIREFENLEQIEELIQNFPIHARSLSHRQLLDDSASKSIVKFQEIFRSAGIKNGMDLLAINGRILAKTDDKIDFFSLIEIMKDEKKVAEKLTDSGFFEKDHPKLLSLFDFSPISVSTYAFDYREAKPLFLNNVDSYPGWRRSLQFILEPFPAGRIRPISRNIFNLVFFINPFSSDSENLKISTQIEELVKSGVYMRIGVVPIFNETREGISLESAMNTRKLGKLKVWKTKETLLKALKNGNRFLEKTGLSSLSSQISGATGSIALFNGYPLDMSSPENFDAILAANIEVQTRRLQALFYHGLLKDDVKIDEFWISNATNPDVLKRISEKIVTSFNERRFVDLLPVENEKVAYFSKDFEIQNLTTNLTTWIIADFSNLENRKIVAKILKTMKKDNKIALFSTTTDSLILADSESCISTSSESEDSEGFDYCSILENLNLAPKFLNLNLNSNFALKNEEILIISNGLIVGPYSTKNEENSDEVLDDLKYLEQFWMDKGARQVSAHFKEHPGDDDIAALKFYSIFSKFWKTDFSRIDFETFKDPEERNMMIFPPNDPRSPYVTITWIANPVSRDAQQIVSIVKLMSKVLNARVEIIFNPPSELLEMPIRRFYRFVASESLKFDDTDGSIQNHEAVFEGLPQKQLLTMSVETNDGWMIEVKQAETDLDNILLEKTSEDVDAVFSLEHILVEGQSMKTDVEPSEGVELELTSSGDVVKYDTIVMRNLGYFQLKAEPGVWNMGIRKSGTSSEKFRIHKLDSEFVEDNSDDVSIVVDSFNGKWTKLIVEEMEVEGENETEDEKSVMKKLVEQAKSFFSTPAPSETINVFSVASGHLYERFMRIMMVSVMKNTQSEAKVKFWLLKNYLSPKFKKSIPKLAEAYGFEYELVEYKWPKWLRQQTEKQRVMWGYKILFLDVLFPLNVDKIIYVDADQVVRADLLELMNFNLQGAPYGYVPFCDSRKEMDGFRFWKSGYWRNQLMGRSYHISALYVVDLKAFRSFAAGDRIRGRYEALSADPNSLSNLDQDLPNNMIHEVPIKSLPQDWLWCETWCDDRSKKTAKTIDLCNNPLTKEPKLNSAQRIIAEWTDLDDEISTVISKTSDSESSESLTSSEEREEL